MSDGMSLPEAAFMGLVQGLTEFLPISSSAHIRILGDLVGQGEPGAAFTAMIQIGTELAVLLYFRRDIVRIVVAWARALAGAYGHGWRARVGLAAGPNLGHPAVGPDATTADLVDTAPARGSGTGPGRAGTSHDALMGWFIIVGSIPIVVLGVLFKDSIESTLRNLWITVAMLSVFALLLGWADKVGAQRRTVDDLTVRHALFFGLWQALALVPGVSRSGGTITGGRLMGYTREAAARYSFLLAMPAVFGAGLLEMVSSLGKFGTCETVSGAATYSPSVAATLVATAISFVVGYVVIIGFLKIVSTYSYKPFVYYRLALAVVVALLLLTGTLHATPPTSACSG